jgi:hypothetical protein
VRWIAIEETFASRPSRLTSRSVSIVTGPTSTWPVSSRRRTTSATSTAFAMALPRAFTTTGPAPEFSSATTWKT